MKIFCFTSKRLQFLDGKEDLQVNQESGDKRTAQTKLAIINDKQAQDYADGIVESAKELSFYKLQCQILEKKVAAYESSCDENIKLLETSIDNESRLSIELKNVYKNLEKLKAHNSLLEEVEKNTQLRYQKLARKYDTMQLLVNEHEKFIFELEKSEMELKRKLKLFENAWRAVVLWNIWCMTCKRSQKNRSYGATENKKSPESKEIRDDNNAQTNSTATINGQVQDEPTVIEESCDDNNAQTNLTTTINDQVQDEPTVIVESCHDDNAQTNLAIVANDEPALNDATVVVPVNSKKVWRLTDFPKNLLFIDYSYKLRILHTKKHYFIMAKIKHELDIFLLENEMNKYYEKEDKNPEFKPGKYEVCAVKNDGRWYRGMCFFITHNKDDDQSYHVDLFDWKNTVIVKSRDIRKLETTFMTLSPQAFKCTLLNFNPNHVQKRNLRRVYNKVFKCTVHSNLGGNHFVVQSESIIRELN